MNRKVIYRLLAWVIMSAVYISQCTGFAVSAQETDVLTAISGKTAVFELQNPVMEEDSSMAAGQKVTWDCVWFGSYPQAEVVASKEEYIALDGDLLRDGDLIEDRGLYNSLKNASGWDANNDITLYGQKYRRMAVDKEKKPGSGNTRYYRWDEVNTYHYFKYEPIKWLVLKREDNRAMLLSEITLDYPKYNTYYTSITWEKSSIRSWLNGYGASYNQPQTDYAGRSFIERAFSAEERAAIFVTNVVNLDSFIQGTEGGNDTWDKIFLLSESEVYGRESAAYGFVPNSNTHDEARCCKSSTYAKAMGTPNYVGEPYTGNCHWWLRSPGGYASTDAAYVSINGYVSSGSGVDKFVGGGRVALNLDLSSDQWSYAGTVCSDGTDGKEPSDPGELDPPVKETSLKDATVTFTGRVEAYYTGQPQCPAFTVTCDGKKLTEGKDYSVSYTNNVNPSLDPYCADCYGGIYDSKNREKYAKISITGIYPYKDTIERTFRIGGFSDLTAVRGIIWNYEYTGKEICPKPEIVLYEDGEAGDILTENVDYRMSYQDNTEPGTATILVTGIGKYQGYGSFHIHYTIAPKDNKEDDGVDLFTYQFGNTRSDFGYAPDYTIDEESIFTKLWGNTALAQQNYDYWTENFKVWCGNCYGMSATSIMFLDNRDDIEISGFNSGASHVKELELDDYNRNSNIRMSLLDFIEVMQVSQVDETVSYLIGKSNKGKLNRLCDALKNAEESDTAILIVLDSNGPQGAHAVVGYHLEDVSETERRIYIYDCNHPNASRYITLTMAQGACTGWNYDGGNEGKSMIWSSEKIGDVSCTISYISYDSFVKVWLNRSLGDKPDSGKNVMTLNVANASICDKNGRELAVLEDGEIRSENEEIFAYYPVCATLDGNYDKSEMQPMIYLPTDEYVVKNTDEKSDELKMTMCNVDRKIEVITSAPSVAVNVSDSNKVNTIQIEGEEERVEANFYSSDSSEQYKTMNYIGHVIGSSPMMLGSAGGEKVIQNFDIVSEKVENKEPLPDEKPADKDEKPTKPADKEEKPEEKEENPKNNISFKIVSSTGSQKIAAGKKVKLTVITTPENTAKPKLHYTSSNEKVATVNQKGVVSIKKKTGGKTVVITAVNDAGQKADVKFTVMKGAVKKIKVTGAKSCKAGKSLKLKAKVTAGKGANKNVVWKSSNTQYAQVTKNGTVKTKKKGKGKKVKITAAATDGSGKKGSVVIVIK
ncbi:MAG: Ig-like domain-containing protein [Eubacterium sp.]|nr:Ig-like domain-containing protein [Eubacterium sp.]